jgi:hypothetical protein
MLCLIDHSVSIATLVCFSNHRCKLGLAFAVHA